MNKRAEHWQEHWPMSIVVKNLGNNLTKPGSNPGFTSHSPGNLGQNHSLSEPQSPSLYNRTDQRPLSEDYGRGSVPYITARACAWKG